MVPLVPAERVTILVDARLGVGLRRLVRERRRHREPTRELRAEPDVHAGLVQLLIEFRAVEEVDTVLPLGTQARLPVGARQRFRDGAPAHPDTPHAVPDARVDVEALAVAGEVAQIEPDRRQIPAGEIVVARAETHARPVLLDPEHGDHAPGLASRPRVHLHLAEELRAQGLGRVVQRRGIERLSGAQSDAVEHRTEIGARVPLDLDTLEHQRASRGCRRDRIPLLGAGDPRAGAGREPSGERSHREEDACDAKRTVLRVHGLFRRTGDSARAPGKQLAFHGPAGP